jgi:hypothetical protein
VLTTVQLDGLLIKRPTPLSDLIEEPNES